MRVTFTFKGWPGSFVRSKPIKSVYFALIAICLGGLLPFATPNSIAFAIFDGLFILTGIALFLTRGRIDRPSLLIAALCLAYVAVDYVMFRSLIESGFQTFSFGNLKDFIYSDKFIFYIALFFPFVRANKIPADFFRGVFYAFLACALIKYSYMHVLGEDRPRIVVENNYELAWFLIFFIVHASQELRSGREIPHTVAFFVSSLVLLSGSRSVAVCLIPVLMFLYCRGNIRSIILSFLAIPIGLGLVYYIFAMRTNSDVTVDRLRFFEAFKYEIGEFSAINYLFGMKPLSNLSAGTCQQFAYYQSLFSADGSGDCYSLVFHSFFMRTFYDHGIIGALGPFLVIYALLVHSGYKMREALTMVGITVACAISVSGPGSSFIAFPLALAFAWRPNDFQKERSPKCRRAGTRRHVERKSRWTPLFPSSPHCN